MDEFPHAEKGSQWQGDRLRDHRDWGQHGGKTEDEQDVSSEVCKGRVEELDESYFTLFDFLVHDVLFVDEVHDREDELAYIQGYNL